MLVTPKSGVMPEAVCPLGTVTANAPISGSLVLHYIRYRHINRGAVHQCGCCCMGKCCFFWRFLLIYLERKWEGLCRVSTYTKNQKMIFNSKKKSGFSHLPEEIRTKCKQGDFFFKQTYVKKHTCYNLWTRYNLWRTLLSHSFYCLFYRWNMSKKRITPFNEAHALQYGLEIASRSAST